MGVGLRNHEVKPCPSAFQAHSRGWLRLAQAEGRGRPRQQAWSRVPLLDRRQGCLVQPQSCSHRKNYDALWQMYQKIQPLLENLHRNFTETQNNISKQRVGRAAQADCRTPSLPLCCLVQGSGALVPRSCLDMCLEFGQLSLG